MAKIVSKLQSGKRRRPFKRKGGLASVYRVLRAIGGGAHRVVRLLLVPLDYVRTHTTVRAHHHLRRKIRWYDKWHNRRHHKKVHYGVLALYLAGVVAAFVFYGKVFAISTWQQTDWSGGIGASTTTQYSAGSNVAGASGSVVLSANERLTNTGFESDLSDWLLNADNQIVQSNISTIPATATTGPTVSLTNPAAAGNLLLAAFQADSNPGTITNPTGYTTVATVNDTTNSSAYTRVAYKVATGGETSISFSTSSSVIQTAALYEIAFINASGGPDTSATAATTAQVATLTVGPTATTSVANTFGFLAKGDSSNGLTAMTMDGGYSLGQVNNRLNIGYGNQSAIGAVTINLSAMSATRRHAAVLAIFKDSRQITRDTAEHHSGAAAAKMITTGTIGEYIQKTNVVNTTAHIMEAYVKKSDASAVTSSDAELYYNTATLSTSYTSAGNGWYKLTGTFTGVNATRNYGVQVKANKTVYIDDLSVRNYNTPGTLDSNIFDTGQLSSWDVVSYTATVPTNTTLSVKVRTSNSATMSGAPAFSTCTAITSGNDISTNSCVTDGHRYVQYEVLLANSDTSLTPTLASISIGYLAYDNGPPPTNASSLQMKRVAGGASISSNGWTNGSSPYFSWTAGADEGGGSGIKGYCLYLGQDGTANPVTSKGLLGTSPVTPTGTCQFIINATAIDIATSGYLATALTTSNSPYYLSVKAIDNANNVYSGSSAQFQFRFDNTAPINPAYLTAPSQFVATEDVTVTWPTASGDAASDANSGLAGLQYRIGSSGTWYGDSHNGSQDATDLLTNDGTYLTNDAADHTALVDGNNTFYVRTWDAAGNVTSNYVTAVIKVNTSSPSSPQNVSATPATNTTNSFAFNWSAPQTYVGTAASLTYCYTINTLPTVNTCNFTAAGVTSLDAGAYATQPGDNTFYVVAKDEAGNINYSTFGSVVFTANTAAPGIPLNMDIADISVKTTSNWKLTISWEQPTTVGAGVASYKIYRSTNGTSFTNTASTAGTSFVDSGLTQTTYYYQVKACDSTNNCGALSTIVSKKPTGKFVTAAGQVGRPLVDAISTRKATIRWVTDRDSDSRIEFGLASGNYFPTESANSTQLSVHAIQLDNLTAGTTYYYRAKWTDVDGNTGVSAESSFTTQAAPTVKEVSVRDINLTLATIRFTLREAHKVKIYYGKTEGFGGAQTLNTSASESTYDSQLTGLDDGSKYYFKVNTFDSDGNEYDGNIFSFATPARPRISNLRFQPVEGEPTSTQQISWTTNVAATTNVVYSSAATGRSEQADSTFVTEHSMTIRGLADDSEYRLTAQSRDDAGNLAVSDEQVFHTSLDTRPPAISDVVIEDGIRGTGSEARGQIIVSWKTDEPSTSQVAYGEGIGGSDYTTRTVEDASLVTDHIVIISDLPTSRTYHLKAISRDRSHNSGASGDQSTIIGRASDSVIGIIFNALQKVFSFLQ